MVLPVGHVLGPFFTDEHAEIPESVDIRLGEELISIPSGAYAVWAAAHGEPGVDSGMPRAATIAAAAQLVDEPDRWFDQLTARSLLVELPDTPQARQRFARSHRVLPLALGLGNSAEHPDRFIVGMVGAPAVTLPASAFLAWMFGHRYPSLWQTCENVVNTTQLMIGAEVDPAAVLADVITLLSPLLVHGCACLDRRTDG
ncbi:MAG: hypothetical protein ACR2JX_02995 [Mycobacteriales bacterium]